MPPEPTRAIATPRRPPTPPVPRQRIRTGRARSIAELEALLCDRPKSPPRGLDIGQLVPGLRALLEAQSDREGRDIEAVLEDAVRAYLERPAPARKTTTSDFAIVSPTFVD